MGDELIASASASPSADSPKRLLLVILADLDEPNKEKLVEALQQSARASIKLETWTPSWQLLASVAKQAPHRDSQANIYATTILAYRKGFERCLIADNLSKRQLNQQTRWREDQKLSLIHPFCDLASARFGSVIGTRDDWVSIIVRTTLNQIIMDPQETMVEMADGPNENLLSPDEPFYRVDPWWDRYLFTQGWVPIFCITNRLTDTQKADLQREIVTMGNPHAIIPLDIQEYRPVPWKQGRAGEVDGKGSDIWEIVQKVVARLGFGRHVFSCIDAESVVDRSVLIVKPDIYMGGMEPGDIRLARLRGCAYARILANRALFYAQALFQGQLEIENLEHAGGWYHRFKRPDWPENLDNEELGDDNSDSD